MVVCLSVSLSHSLSLSLSLSLFLSLSLSILLFLQHSHSLLIQTVTVVFCSGVGYGIIFGPCMVVVGQFFNKRRSLANGLAAAGGSLGQLVIPMMITVLLEKYGFQVK